MTAPDCTVTGPHPPHPVTHQGVTVWCKGWDPPPDDDWVYE